MALWYRPEGVALGASRRAAERRRAVEAAGRVRPRPRGDEQGGAWRSRHAVEVGVGPHSQEKNLSGSRTSHPREGGKVEDTSRFIGLRVIRAPGCISIIWNIKGTNVGAERQHF